MPYSIERIEVRVIKVPVVDVRANLDPREAQFLHAASHFHNGQVRGLHW